MAGKRNTFPTTLAIVQLCLTLQPHELQDNMTGFPVLHYLPEFAQIHIYWLSDANRPSCHSLHSVILCHSLLLLPSIFPRIRVFSDESALHIRWPKYCSFSFTICSFRVDFFWHWLIWSSRCPRDSQESSSAPQFKSINSMALSLLYGPTLTSVHDSWKNHSCDYTDLCLQNDVSAL